MNHKHFFLSLYGWTYWLPILLAGGLVMLTLAVIAIASGSVAAWVAGAMVAVLTFAGLAFFRDFPRAIPADSDVMLAPADGKITEITKLEHYEPLGGPALRVGIFLSVLDVHVNRSPCAAVVLSTRFQPGLFLDARHPQSGPRNQSNTLLLGDPATQKPIAVVKQIVGAIARRIITPVTVGQALDRGERFGMICFGSRTELYVPAADWQVTAQLGQHVKAGTDILLRRR